jgi:hypothetical protein
MAHAKKNAMLIITKWKCLKNQSATFLELKWTFTLGIEIFHKYKMFKTRFEGSWILFELNDLGIVGNISKRLIRKWTHMFYFKTFSSKTYEGCLTS